MLTILFINLIFMCVTANMFAIITPLAAAEYGVSDAAIGLMGAAVNFIPLTVDIPLAGFTERFGSGKIYRCGLLIAVSAVLIPVSFPTAAGIIAGYLFYKLASTVYSLPLLSMISLAPTKLTQSRVQGINGFLQGVCGIAGSLLAGFLKDHCPVQVIYATLLAFTAAGLILSFFVKDAERPGAAHPVSISGTFKGAAEMLRSNTGIQKATALEVIDCFIIYGVYTTYFGLLVTGNFGHSASFLGVLLSTRVILSTVMNLAYPRIADRFGKFVPVCVFFAAGAAVIYLLPFFGQGTHLMILVIILGIAAGLSPAAPNTLIGESCDSADRPLAFAVTSIVSGVVCTLISLLFSWLSKFYDIGVLFRVSGAGGVVFALASIFFFRNKRDRQGDPD